MSQYIRKFLYLLYWFDGGNWYRDVYIYNACIINNVIFQSLHFLIQICLFSRLTSHTSASRQRSTVTVTCVQCMPSHITQKLHCGISLSLPSSQNIFFVQALHLHTLLARATTTWHTRDARCTYVHIYVHMACWRATSNYWRQQWQRWRCISHDTRSFDNFLVRILSTILQRHRRWKILRRKLIRIKWNRLKCMYIYVCVGALSVRGRLPTKRYTERFDGRAKVAFHASRLWHRFSTIVQRLSWPPIRICTTLVCVCISCSVHMYRCVPFSQQLLTGTDSFPSALKRKIAFLLNLVGLF